LNPTVVVNRRKEGVKKFDKVMEGYGSEELGLASDLRQMADSLVSFLLG